MNARDVEASSMKISPLILQHKKGAQIASGSYKLCTCSGDLGASVATDGSGGLGPLGMRHAEKLCKAENIDQVKMRGVRTCY